MTLRERMHDYGVAGLRVAVSQSLLAPSGILGGMSFQKEPVREGDTLTCAEGRKSTSSAKSENAGRDKSAMEGGKSHDPRRQFNSCGAA